MFWWAWSLHLSAQLAVTESSWMWSNGDWMWSNGEWGWIRTHKNNPKPTRTQSNSHCLTAPSIDDMVDLQKELGSFATELHEWVPNLEPELPEREEKLAMAPEVAPYNQGEPVQMWQCVWVTVTPGILQHPSQCRGCCFTSSFKISCSYLSCWPLFNGTTKGNEFLEL